MDDISAQYDKKYRYCFFRLKDRELSEDVTQEAFLRCLHQTDGRLPIRLLYRIARNLCIDEYRRMKEIPTDEDPDAAISDFSESLVSNIILAEALKRLTDEEREILLLRFANEESLAVIGSLYGISRFAAYRKVQGILKKCREYIEGRQER